MSNNYHLNVEMKQILFIQILIISFNEEVENPAQDCYFSVGFLRPILTTFAIGIRDVLILKFEY